MGCGGIRRGVTGRKVVRDIMLVAINRSEITVLYVNVLGILKKTHSGKNVRTRITGGAPRSLGAGTRITRACYQHHWGCHQETGMGACVGQTSAVAKGTERRLAGITHRA